MSFLDILNQFYTLSENIFYRTMAVLALRRLDAPGRRDLDHVAPNSPPPADDMPDVQLCELTFNILNTVQGIINIFHIFKLYGIKYL